MAKARRQVHPEVPKEEVGFFCDRMMAVLKFLRETSRSISSGKKMDKRIKGIVMKIKVDPKRSLQGHLSHADMALKRR